MHLSLAFLGVDPREHAGNGTFLTIFWARGVGTLFGFGNERFRLQGCTPGIWSPLVSGTWFSKSRMNSLPPFVFISWICCTFVLHQTVVQCLGCFTKKKKVCYCRQFQWIRCERWAKFHFVRFRRFRTYIFNILKRACASFNIKL